MHHHSLELLDFFRIRNHVLNYIRSHEGTALLTISVPYTTTNEVLEEQECIRAIVNQFHANKYLPPTECPDISSVLPKLSKEGTVLETDELLALGLWARSFESFHTFLAPIEHKKIAACNERAPNLNTIIHTVFHICNDDGSIRDLPELKPFRNKTHKLLAEIEKITASLCANLDLKGILQNDLPTIRDGRTVLAVKSTYKNKLPGIVHEISDTGQTTFIEPEILVQKNNELVEAEAEYQRALFAVLKEATASIRIHYEEIITAQTLLAQYDIWHAKAHYSHVNKSVFIEHSETSIELYNARHPLLGSKAVPVTIALPPNKRELIITGPNTGGKTVTLKTIGLFALMNQFGLALPVSEGSKLPIFGAVLVDLGDEQSIDTSLSTFSAHIKTIAEITAHASNNSLILLDELGSGTDPEEGGALAMALLDYFRERSCTVFVTSHLSILKKYAYDHEETLNASVEFDKDTLSPTYKLIMGFPGESHALTIASRYGMPGAIIEKAQSYCSKHQADFSSLLRELHSKYQELETKNYTLEKTKQELTEQQRKLDLESLRLKQQVYEIKKKEGTELKLFLDESRKTLENLVRAIQEGTLTKEKTVAVKQFLHKLEEKTSSVEQELEAEKANSTREEPIPETDQPLEPGIPVMIRSSRKEGLLVRKTKNAAWIVAVDSLKLTVPEKDLIPIKKQNMRPSTSVEATIPNNARSLLELDLRGYRLADALNAVEQQIHTALLAHISSFSIIHGTGEGILQKGIHELLKKQPLVADYYFARAEEGGYGKTIVVLQG